MSANKNGITKCAIKILIRIGLPIIVFFLLDIISNIGQHDDYKIIFDIIHHLSKLFYYIALIGAGSIFLEEVLENSLVPVIEESLDDLSSRLTSILRDKEIYFKIDGSIHQYDLQLQNITQQLKDITNSKESLVKEIENKNNPELENIKEMLLRGDFNNAIKILNEMAKENPEYQVYLLNALILSRNQFDLISAESILPEHGEPKHYHRLAYAYWLIGNVNKAVKLEEKAKELLEKNPDTNLIDLNNSLAYYYADAECTEKAEFARKLAEEELLSREKNRAKEPGLYADCLDTLGYIKITFGKTKEDVNEGIKDCEDARRLGAEALFFKHLSRAYDRLKSLS